MNDTAAAAMNGFLKLQEIAKTHWRDENFSFIAAVQAIYSPEISDYRNKKLDDVYVSDEVCEDCNGLWKALQGISDVAISYKVTEDTMYDINIAIKDIIEYVKHLMWDAQQYDAFSLLDHDTGFWIKDFAQKVLPVKFREGQKDYFGKKAMSMHIDVFMVGKSGQLKKHVYVTVIYRCDQRTSAIISIADTVLNQFQKDEPDVKKLLTKSDNAGCYHANYSAESMYNLCKAKGKIMILMWEGSMRQRKCCSKDNYPQLCWCWAWHSHCRRCISGTSLWLWYTKCNGWRIKGGKCSTGGSKD